MKKVYKKPMAYIENFEMSQHIAACQFPIKDKSHALKDGCNADVPGLGIEDMFYWKLAGTSVCQTDGEEFYCYTENSQSEVFVFSS